MDRVILRAAQFADMRHASQKRKYTGEPYIRHPMRVAGHTSLLFAADEHMVAAAWLHDVVEDCGVAVRDVEDWLPIRAWELVMELTNPSKQHPGDLTRAERKAMDREHIARASVAAREIKLIDRWDNLREMHAAPAEFIETYVAESLLLLDAINLPTHPYDGLIRQQCHLLRNRSI